MKMKKLIIFFFSSFALTACGQTQNTNSNQNTNIKTKHEMDLSKISNEIVRKAIEALQDNDKNTWYSYFTEDAIFTDDGRTMNFKSFFDIFLLSFSMIRKSTKLLYSLSLKL